MDHGEYLVERTLNEALFTTQEVESPALQHLPALVRFRAAGALHSWERVFATLPRMASARAAFARPATSADAAQDVLMKALAPFILVDEGAIRPATYYMVLGLLKRAGEMLHFWLHAGVLYEPSPALDAVLGRSDISEDMPIQLLTPPTSTLCIVISPEQRPQCGGAGAITLFEQRATADQPRQLAIGLHVPLDGGRLFSYEILLSCGSDETLPLRGIIESGERMAEQALGQDLDPSVSTAFRLAGNCRGVLGYLAKVLLYLKLDNAMVREHRPYSTASRVFPGLGKRKRELKLAEIEQLYDRYIIGPEVLS